MGIRILCLGRSKQGFINDGINEYLKRMSSYTKIDLIELPDVKLTSSTNIEIVKNKEADIIEKYLKDRDYLVVLDEHGQQMGSKIFSNFLDAKISKNIIFLIGGVYGLSERIINKADYKLSFSKMTFTHQMIRLILAEQIYRAYTIMKGKKYHY